MPQISLEKLQAIASEIFLNIGATKVEAERVAEHLVTSNLVGHDSHGIIRIPQYVKSIKEGGINLDAKIDVIQETNSIALLDGNWGFGQVIAKKAMDLAIDKAAKSSISCVSVYNCNHIGRLGEYSEMAAKRDMIGIISVNNSGTGRIVAPYGGTVRRLSPNPISISFPTESENPILLDISCSVVAEGKLRVKFNRKEEVPEGWIIDSSGNPTTNPADFYGSNGSISGAILPLGGNFAYKGFGLGFVLDVLCGALSKAGCSREDATRIGNAIFIEAINISDFRPLDEFKAEVEKLRNYVKSSPLAPGFREILVPGEIEYREKSKRVNEGIFVEEGTWNQIAEIAKSLE